jgi:hypothetical protein
MMSERTQIDDTQIDDTQIVLERTYEKYKKAKARETKLSKEIYVCRQKEGKYSDIHKEFCILRRERLNAARTTRILYCDFYSLSQNTTSSG